LRSYLQPPAGPVTITRADGTVEVEPPQKAVRDVPKAAKRAKSSTQPAQPKAPTMKQLLTVGCPVPGCLRPAGASCTLRGGHRARAELFLRVNGPAATPVGRSPKARKPAATPAVKCARRGPASADG
jgi:hypothetical protein